VFVYGSYQGLRDHREAQTVTAFVPSAAQRGGDFTGSKTLTNPKDSITGAPLVDAAGVPAWLVTASPRVASVPSRRSS